MISFGFWWCCCFARFSYLCFGFGFAFCFGFDCGKLVDCFGVVCELGLLLVSMCGCWLFWTGLLFGLVLFVGLLWFWIWAWCFCFVCLCFEFRFLGVLIVC